jgi:hypothetical protein
LVESRSVGIATTLRSIWRLLTFRSTREELRALDHRHVTGGLLATLLVGIGRYGDAASASWVERLGLESVLYVGGLSLLVWLLGWLLAPASFGPLRVLAFVSLTALPGALDAVPVSAFVQPWEAVPVNAWLEGLVAAWRTALLLWFLTRQGLHWLEAAISSLVCVDVIVIALAAFDVRHPLSEHVNGWRSLDYFAVLGYLAFPPLMLSYVGVVVRRLLARHRRLSTHGS